ncbi:hypothetical protein GCM10027284_08290 [Cyclobacterium sediminis]
MNKLIIIVFLSALIVACQTNTGKQTQIQYPSDFTKVLEAHGGIDQWKKGRTLNFRIGDPTDGQKHTVDLHSRMDKITTSDYEIGFDGIKAWVLNKEGKYQRNPTFMHDLMFYFYAMPFVLADEGLNYEKIIDKEIKGETYQGIKISFEPGVGNSSGDEYYLYYDPETYQMAWLAYKATFGKDKKPEWPNFISYDKWSNVGGVLLPTSIAWYSTEEGQIGEERNRVDFNSINLSQEAQPEAFYSKPENAVFAEEE